MNIVYSYLRLFCRHLLCLIVLTAVALACDVRLSAEAAVWKAGFARNRITPDRPFWMGGFAMRTRPAEGTLDDLWVKTLVLEDAAGQLGIVVTADLLGFPKSIYDRVCAALSKKHGLRRDQIVLCASHTHCGPALRNLLYDCYPLDDQQRRLIEEYSDSLESTIVETVDSAMIARKTVSLWAGEGRAGFAVNRCTNVEQLAERAIQRGDPLNGPVDHSVPVLAVRDETDNLCAVLFGYAAHPSVINREPAVYRYSGDYAGAAQRTLEQAHPGAQAMFFQGCGSDQSALPRGTPELSQTHGQTLASAVEAVLREPMRQLEPDLRTELAWVRLELQPPTYDHLMAATQGLTYRSRWAKRLLAEINAGRTPASDYPEYPVQVWLLGREQLWIILGGEVCVEYPLALKQRYGQATWIAAYANDLMAYIPSARIWEEGGYQAGAFDVYGLFGVRWTPDIEQRIIGQVEHLVDRARTAKEAQNPPRAKM